MLAFDNMPNDFSLMNIVQMARSFMGRPMCTDGTITRRLRELRDELPEKYGYVVIDTENSKYQKRQLTKKIV